MVSLPLWAVFAVGFGSPILAFLGVLVAQTVARRRDTELETRSKREETMRNLRWAAELSASPDSRVATLGLTQLRALLASDMLDDTEKVFVEAALGIRYQARQAELEDLGADAGAVHYAEGEDVVNLSDEVHIDVFSKPEDDEGSSQP